jgi:hypothetical protein
MSRFGKEEYDEKDWGRTRKNYGPKTKKARPEEPRLRNANERVRSRVPILSDLDDYLDLEFEDD